MEKWNYIEFLKKHKSKIVSEQKYFIIFWSSGFDFNTPVGSTFESWIRIKIKIKRMKRILGDCKAMFLKKNPSRFGADDGDLSTTQADK